MKNANYFIVDDLLSRKVCSFIFPGKLLLSVVIYTSSKRKAYTLISLVMQHASESFFLLIEKGTGTVDLKNKSGLLWHGTCQRDPDSPVLG